MFDQVVRSFTIAFTARSGSNAICDILERNGFGLVNEWFAQPIIPVGGEPWFKAFVRLVNERQGGGVFGSKMAHDQRSALDANLHKAIPGYRCLDDVLPGHRWLHLVRKDKVLQAISLCRAEFSNRWARTEADQTHRDELKYDFFHILSRIMMIQVSELAWNAFFQQNGIEPFRIVYEDFFQDILHQMPRLIDHLGGLPPGRESLETETKYKTQRDDISNELRERFIYDLDRMGDPKLEEEIGAPWERWAQFFSEYQWRSSENGPGKPSPHEDSRQNRVTQGRVNDLQNRKALADSYIRRSQFNSGMPMILQIESTSICNLKCIMCPHPIMGRKNENMSMTVYERIIKEGAGFLEFIWLHHFGEPLMNPDIYKMIDMAEDAGIRTGMGTNATVLDEKASAALLDSKLSLLYISLHGATKQNFENIRVGANFETVHANVARFAEMKRACNSEMLVRLHTIDMTSTGNEKEQLEEEWRDKGFDAIEKTPYPYWANQDQSLIRIEEASPPTPSGACSEPWIGFSILADGTAVPCCNDYSGKMPLGDLKTQSLREIWNGPEMMKLRKRFAGPIPDVTGTLCERCPFPVLLVKKGQAVFSSSSGRVDQPHWYTADMPVLAPSDPHLVNLSFKTSPLRAEPGQPIACTIAIENRSPGNLCSAGKNAVHISYHWIDSSGSCVVFDGLRARLVPDLPSGRQRTYPVDVIAPDIPGQFTLRVTLVQEHVAWFDQFDPRNATECTVEVVASGEECAEGASM